MEQMVRFVQSRIGRDRSEAVLRLDPPELGSVRLHMHLRDNVLSLRVEPQTALAHALLSRDLDELRHNLEAAGIRLEHVELRPPPAGTEPGQSDSSAFQPQPEARSEQQQHMSPSEYERQGAHGRAADGTEPDGTAGTEVGASAMVVTESRVNVWA
jgi:flagellar hook-length control protein FliK